MKTLPLFTMCMILVLFTTAQTKMNPLFDEQSSNNLLAGNKIPSEVLTPDMFGIDNTFSNGRMFDPYKKENDLIKSATTEKQRLDSTVVKRYDQATAEWINSYKYVAEYDSSGHQVVFLIVNWNTQLNTWVNATKNEFKYNAAGKIMSEQRFVWNAAGNKWDNKTKYEYDYDQDGNLILDSYYNWVGNPAFWRGAEKKEFRYDSSRNLLFNAVYGWNNQENKWEGKEKYEFQFDENGNKLQEAYFQWRYSDFGSEGFKFGWANSYMVEIKYDEKNRITQTTKGVWSPDSTTYTYISKKLLSFNSTDSIETVLTYYFSLLYNTWKEESKDVYVYEPGKTSITSYFTDYNDSLKITNFRERFYNSSGKITSDIKYFRPAAADTLVGDTKIEFTYHLSGTNVSGSVSFKFDINANKWIPVDKYEYPEYDQFGNNTQVIKSTWYQLNNSWKYFSKMLYNFNEDNVLTLLSSYSWNESLGNWTGYKKNEYDFDNNSNKTEITDYTWDVTRNDWKGTSRIEYLYDHEYNMDDLILPNWIALSQVYSKPTEILYFIWNATSDNWANSQMHTMYYSSIIIDNSSEHADSKTTLYPNPAASRIYINNLDGFDFVTIYNANGKAVFERRMDAMLNEIDTESFVSGLYFVRLSGKNKNQVFKVVKQ